MREVAPGVWQLRGFPPNFTNTYLIDDILIDANTRQAAPGIIRQLADRPLRLVALTHCHPDHQGAASRVCQTRGVPLACPSGDVPMMEGRAPMIPANRLVRFLDRRWSGPSHPVAQPLAEGDRLGDFQVLHLPGHTPGHCIFFRERDGVAIVGDVVRNLSFATGLRQLLEPPLVFTVDPALNRVSIRRLAALSPRLICCGHGTVIRDMNAFAHFVERLPGD